MCAVNTFWTSAWSTPPQTRANGDETELSTTTLGDQARMPAPPAEQIADRVRIPGSSVGAIPTQYSTVAKLVYPVFDGVTVGPVYDSRGVLQSASTLLSLAIDPLANPPTIDFNRYPSSFWTSSAMDTLGTAPQDFTNWHSAFQAEYIVAYSTNNSITPPAYQIGTSPSIAAVYMLDDKNRPVNLLALTLSDYAKLTDTEKQRFNANLISSGHLTKLGLSTDATDKTNLVVGTGDTANPGLNEYLATIASSTMSAEQKLLFSTQIQMLKDEVNAAYAFSAEKIRAAAGEVMGRFKILDAFIRAGRPQTLTITASIYQDRVGGFGADFDQSATSSTLTKTTVNCLDGGETMDKGIEQFVRAETEILNMKQRRAVIAENSAYRDPNLDVPNLIYQLQLLYEGEKKGVVDAGTEEFRQLHKLLEDYNVMQQLLSTTISVFDTSKTDDKRRFMNIGVKDDGDVDEKQVQSTEAVLQSNEYDEAYSPYATPIDTEDASPRYHWSVLANFTDSLATMNRDFATTLDAADNGVAGPGKIYWSPHKGDVTGKLTQNQMIAFSMFADEPWARTSERGHPIEELYGSTRPSFDMIDQSEEGAGSLKLLSKNAFDQFQTQISNAITILNQQNQIKQNDVENATKEQNRHFELGSNALRKMNDLLLMIGRL